MNVLHVSTSHSWRGGEQQLAYLIEELALKKIEQWILCVKGSRLESYCIEQNVNHFTFIKRSSFSIGTARKIQQICNAEQIDIIHTHDSHGLTFAVLAARIFGNNSSIVVSRRVDFPIGKNVFSKWKYNHPSIKKILTVSNFIKELIAPIIKDKSKIKVVYDGIDTGRFLYKKSGILHQEFSLEEDVKLVGNIAALAPHKDYYTFVNTVKAFFQVSNKKVMFFIIGADDGEQEAIENLIKEKKLKDKIILTGFRNDIPRILPELDVFLFTSKEEGLGTSILDAFACEVPVVATRAGGIPEIVLHSKTGLTAEVGDAHQLAEHVHSILTNPKFANILTTNAIAAVKDFSIGNMARETYKSYVEIVE